MKLKKSVLELWMWEFLVHSVGLFIYFQDFELKEANKSDK